MRSAPAASIASAASTARSGVEEAAAVGERVRGDVEDAHDERALAEAERAAVGEREVEDAAGEHGDRVVQTDRAEH